MRYGHVLYVGTNKRELNVMNMIYMRLNNASMIIQKTILVPETIHIISKETGSPTIL